MDIVRTFRINLPHSSMFPEMGGAKIYFLTIVHCLRTERAARSAMTTKSSLFHFSLKPGAFQNRWPHLVLERSESTTKGRLVYIYICINSKKNRILTKRKYDVDNMLEGDRDVMHSSIRFVYMREPRYQGYVSSNRVSNDIAQP